MALAVTKKRKKGHRCCVYKCKSDTVLNRNVSFHLFPKDPALREIWVSRVNETSPRGLHSSWTPTKHHKICGKHFHKSGKKSKEHTVPVLFDNKVYSLIYFDTLTAIKPEVVIGNCDTKEERMNISAENVYVKTEPEDSVEIVNNGNNPRTIAKNYILQEHSYSIPNGANSTELASAFKRLKGEFEELNEKLSNFTKEDANIKSLQNQVAVLKMQVEQQNKTIIENNSEINSLRTKLQDLPKADFISMIMPKTDKMMKYYTGFNGRQRFQDFVNVLSAPYMEVRTTNLGRPHKLPLEVEALIVLSKLRLGSPDKDLAQKFCVSQSTISNITTFWIDLLSTSLPSFNTWPSRSFVDASMPKAIFETYPTTRVIVDCFKFRIQKTSNFSAHHNNETYSSFKNRSAAKGLIGVSPNGYISFVSELFGDGTSDIEILLKSGLLTQLESGDAVMADEGFSSVRSVLSKIGVELIIPHASGQFSEEEDIAKLRIYVERVLGEIKKWKVLKTIFANTSCNLSYVNKVWKVCCYLQNFI